MVMSGRFQFLWKEKEREWGRGGERKESERNGRGTCQSEPKYLWPKWLGQKSCTWDVSMVILGNSVSRESVPASRENVAVNQLPRQRQPSSHHTTSPWQPLLQQATMQQKLVGYPPPAIYYHGRMKRGWWRICWLRLLHDLSRLSPQPSPCLHSLRAHRQRTLTPNPLRNTNVIPNTGYRRRMILFSMFGGNLA